MHKNTQCNVKVYSVARRTDDSKIVSAIDLVYNIGIVCLCFIHVTLEKHTKLLNLLMKGQTDRNHTNVPSQHHHCAIATLSSCYHTRYRNVTHGASEYRINNLVYRTVPASYDR